MTTKKEKEIIDGMIQNAKLATQITTQKETAKAIFKELEDVSEKTEEEVYDEEKGYSYVKCIRIEIPLELWNNKKEKWVR